MHKAEGVLVAGAGTETQVSGAGSGNHNYFLPLPFHFLIALPTHPLSLIVLVTPYLCIMMCDLIVVARHLEFPE